MSSANISLAAYNNNSAIYACDVEKVPQAAMSGYNTSGGAKYYSELEEVRNVSSESRQEDLLRSAL